MKGFLCILAAALVVVNLIGENPSSAFALDARTPKNRIPDLLLNSRIRNSSRRTSWSRRINCKPEEYDDGIGDVTNPKTDSAGEALASEFYKSLQKRKDTKEEVGLGDDTTSPKKTKGPSLDRRDSISTSPILSPSLGESKTRILFGNNDDVDAEENKPQKAKFKYAGRPTSGNEYVGGFYGDTNNNVREGMMRKEFNLVSAATGRTSYILQAGLALFMLVFFAYVGFTGGIVSGEEALQTDFSGDDFIQFEEIIPVPRDSDNSIWI